MKKLGRKWKFGLLSLLTLVMVLCCLSLAAAKDKAVEEEPADTAGNNLSFPVIWAEGVSKTLPTPVNTETNELDPTVTNIDGAWWYQWGTNGVDQNIEPASCPPDPDEANVDLNPDGLSYCDDGVPESLDEGKLAGVPTADNPLPLVKAYLQKDAGNVWQAASADWRASPVYVNWIDWGDNLESVDWYTRSQVRTEVVLYQDLVDPMLEYEMRHVSGWGIDEVHGLAVKPEDLEDQEVGGVMEGPGTQATVYSHCARLTIQKLPDDASAVFEWDEENHQWTGANDPIFNLPVYEGGDGPGYYSAEINVKGKVIYGYTWNVSKLNDEIVNGGEAAGDYRITFSFDSTCGDSTLNTFFNGTDDDGKWITEILKVVEEEVAIVESDDGGEPSGGIAVIDYANNLTYIDVCILERSGGSQKGKDK